MPYISREKLLAFPLRRNGEHCDMEHANPHFLHGIETVMEYVETLPSEDVVPVIHARWHDVYMISPNVATGICSHCNEKSYIGPLYPFALYCPHCGAMMDQP